MSQTDFKIESFVPTETSDELWTNFFEFNDAMHYETSPDPDDPPMAHQVSRRFMEDPSPYREPHRWLAFNNVGKVIAYCQVNFVTEKAPNYEATKHTCDVVLKVSKSHRRQGLGSKLLGMATTIAMKKNCTSLHTFTSHETGKVFLGALEGEVAIEAAENRLKMAEVDWDMIEAWDKEGPERAPDVKLETFEDVPEEYIEPYCEIYTDLMNQQPLGELDFEEKTTPEKRRVQEKETRDKGCQWFTRITREANGDISGTTEIFYIPEEPHKMHQMLTGVNEKYRGKGLGKWLKANMLLHIRDQYPEVKTIVTGNADSNAPMLSINERMGFKRYLGETVYKFQIKDLCEKLGV